MLRVINDILKTDTPFAMHSIGKMFTGMLAIKMIEMGIISTGPLDNALDKPIQLDPKIMDKLEEYCPAVKEHLTKEGAPTFRQIMLHEGGLDDYLNKYEAAIQKAIDNKEPVPKMDAPEDFLRYAQEEIHELKEGETHYSNLGLLLTGLSIQHHYNLKHPTEKKTYQEILEEFVLQPADISSFALTRPEEGSYNERHPAAAHIQGGPAGGYWIAPMDLLKFGQWMAKQCEDNSFYGLVKEYGGEFQPEKQQIKKGEDFTPEELSHGGQIDSSTSFLGTFLPNGISIAILSNRPFQAAVLEGAIKDHILSQKD
jgi:CubicO group peptidase (beta-lactamase class C family)